MTTIKIECSCGQHYAFDVEPVGGRMPSTVTCPACGVDGTEAANTVIASSVSATPANPFVVEQQSYYPSPTQHAANYNTAPAAGVTSRKPMSHLGRKDPEQAQHEARAKILWGDPPKEVTKYLMMQGFSAKEATELVNELFQERAATIRSDGIRKICIGVGLILVPIVSWFGFMGIGVIYIKLFALTIMAGLYGLYSLINGIIMCASPRSIVGDASEQ